MRSVKLAVHQKPLPEPQWPPQSSALLAPRASALSSARSVLQRRRSAPSQGAAACPRQPFRRRRSLSAARLRAPRHLPRCSATTAHSCRLLTRSAPSAPSAAPVHAAAARASRSVGRRLSGARRPGPRSKIARLARRPRRPLARARQLPTASPLNARTWKNAAGSSRSGDRFARPRYQPRRQPLQLPTPRIASATNFVLSGQRPRKSALRAAARPPLLLCPCLARPHHLWPWLARIRLYLARQTRSAPRVGVVLGRHLHPSPRQVRSSRARALLLWTRSSRRRWLLKSVVAC